MSTVIWQNGDVRVVEAGGDTVAQKRTSGRWRAVSGAAAAAVLKQAIRDRSRERSTVGDIRKAEALLSSLFGQHRWHGVSPGSDAPHKVMSFIEIVPTDTVKYELDKVSGVLKIDRPHRYSNVCPTLYGYIPQTYCGAMVGQRCSERTGTRGIIGDGDPLDICVLTSKAVSHGDILVCAIPIGGLRMIDKAPSGEMQADDKIIAVLQDDPVYGSLKEIKSLSPEVLDPLRHYFLTYKQIPGQEEQPRVKIAEVYGRKESYEVIKRSQADYADSYGCPAQRIADLAELLTGARPSLVRPAK